MAKFYTIGPISLNGKTTPKDAVPAGKFIELNDDEAQFLQAMGVVIPADKAQETPSADNTAQRPDGSPELTAAPAAQATAAPTQTAKSSPVTAPTADATTSAAPATADGGTSK